MMTQTHALMAATLLAKPERRLSHNWAILLGSFAPDAAIFALVLVSKFKDWSAQQLWSEIYFSEPMLTLTAVANSLPLYCLVLFFCVLLYLIKDHDFVGASSVSRKFASYKSIFAGSALGLFALAAIIHLLGDFPVHASDAHPHFWPLSDWRFQSPISYWDHRYHGHFFSVFEAALGVLMSILLFRRFKTIYVRILLALAITAYIVVPIYFSLLA